MGIYSHLLKKFLMEKFIFVHLFVQVNREKTTLKKKITDFLNLFLYSQFLKKSLQFANFFPLGA